MWHLSYHIYRFRRAHFASRSHIVGLKWTYKAKKDASSTIVHKKARLVAQGFLQVPGIDYFDIFAPVTSLTSICIVLALTVTLDMEAHQINIKGAYLYGTLDTNKVIYMWQPAGFIYREHPNWVCQLVKTLYGLKQSDCHWYQRLLLAISSSPIVMPTRLSSSSIHLMVVLSLLCFMLTTAWLWLHWS